MSTFSIVNKTPRTVRALPFRRIKERVLGKKYELSVALVPAAEARRITRKTKNKNHPSNVLSFPLSPASGEIIICPDTATKEAARFRMTERAFLAYLFIHGCLHLKGLRHGGTMERIEARVMKQFKFPPRGE